MSDNVSWHRDDLGALTPQQAKLLEMLIAKGAGAGADEQSQGIEPYPREAGGGALQLSSSWAQQRLWFFDQLQGQSSAYNIPLALRLRGLLNEDALANALQVLTQRHEVLRTVFVNVSGELKQKVVAEGRIDLQRVDLTTHGPTQLDAQIDAHKAEEARAPFDLSTGPLIRTRLLKVRADEHVLLVTMHHIISDGWSIGVFVRELSTVYDALVRGRESPLQPLPIQYADYAQWQREWLRGPRLEQQMSYWSAQLDGAPAHLDLPTDRPRPAVQSYHGASVPLILDAALTSRLRHLAQRQGNTLFMVLYAAWAILLTRLSNQDDLVIGTPVANRRRPEVEGLIGFFVNMLPLRIAITGAASLKELLREVKKVTVEAFDHQDIPFEQLVESLKPERSLSRHPIFQAGIVLQNVSGADLKLPSLEVALEESLNNAAKFDLMLELEERGGIINGRATFATDLFDHETIQRWLACYAVLLEALPGQEATRVDDLPILPTQERRQVVEHFNQTAVPYPHGKLLHQLFEAHASATPDALAVEYEGQTLTYGQLNRRANQLAHFLRTKGIGPDCLVGLCLERGLDLPVALLGVLKAGGAYVPVDPSYPFERIRYMLDDAAPAVLLTHERQRVCLPESRAAVIALDTDWGEIANHAIDNLDVAALGLKPDHLANLIYTSGSTGRPKGVMVPHRGVCNLVSTHQKTLRIDSDSRVLQFASLSFDACTWEWPAALCAGACLYLASRDNLTPGEPLSATLREQRITHAILPPVALGAVSSTEGLEKLGSLMVAGEACAAALVTKWARGRQFMNGYGPTETTVCASLHICDERDAGSPPIGRPIFNAKVYILDNRMRPVPIGVAGEIHVGGVQVTRGYLGRAGLTAERFVADPFGGDRGARMYKTGDLGRWRRDGAIEYLGRNDHQVKIRGFRIELGEIENQLARHGQVYEAAVIAREDVPGQKRLVAYVVPVQQDSAPSVEELRDFLKAALPEYMVPAGIVMLDHLPVTPNGKLDRRALPAPDLTAYATRKFEPPQGALEEIVAGVWQALLHIEKVGRRDNFFELGGHSLLIVQMLERLRRLGLRLGVRDVFDSPTVMELAQATQADAAEQFAVPPNLIPELCAAITPQMLPLLELEPQHIDVIAQSVPAGVANIQDIYPLAPLQEGILFHHLLDEENGDAYVLPLVFELSSRERVDELIDALQAAISRHDILRTAVLWEHLPRPVQIVYRDAKLPVAELALERNRPVAEQVDEWIRPNRQRLDIRRAPLMRLQWAADVQRGDRWYALLQLHHMTIDHVALQVITADIVAHLERRVPVRAPVAPYRNHVAQALAYARTHDAGAFFRGKLAEVLEPTAPFGLLDVHGDGTHIEEARQRVEPALSKRVRAQARREGVSAATLFHAAWALVVSHTSSRDDVVFGTVLLGRLQGNAGAQRTLGMFINTLPLMLKLHGLSAKELVQHTQRELVELLGHEQASLADAQRCSGVVGSAPLFSALLNYRHSVPDPSSEWSSARGVRVLACQERTNYPITLSVDDLGEEGFGLAALVDRRIGPERIIGYLQVAMSSLLHALEEQPEAAALALSIIPTSELDSVVRKFNSTAVAGGGEKLVHQFFEQQAAWTPNAIAALHNGECLSYSEVNARANQLARHLRTAGAGPEQIVAICVERGLEMIVGLLGILKAGAAYLPLDPSYPPERLRQMLDDAAPRLLLTQSQLLGELPQTSTQTMVLDVEMSRFTTEAATNLAADDVGVTLSNPCYVIYTSGSTGKPKGTVMPHGAMANLLQWHRGEARLGKVQRVLQFAALSFDVAFQEIFSTLATGGTLVLLDEWVRKDARALLDLVAMQAVQRMFLPPLMLQSLAECCDLNSAATLRLKDVIVAGEQLRCSREIAEFFNQLDDCRLHNHYGPTETHVVSTLTLEGDARKWPSLPAIGRPLANTQIYILDSKHRPVAIDVPGEIYIAGANVARGYLHRSELTAQRFLRDPFSNEPNARMYKTGDLGRWRADASIEYLGRNDDQVKIRGYRIELGEIEAQLSRHPDVREAAVTVREDAAGSKRIVAYITCHADNRPTVESLRMHVKEMLPEHMIPSAFAILEALPLTPSGKLNRRALPPPDLDAYVINRHEPTQGPLEAQLASIWQEVLGIERIGRHEHFFELGGHSLLALRMLLRINHSLGCALRVADIYKSPTVSRLAECIRGNAAKDDYVDLSKEAVLDQAIVPLPGRRNVPEQAVFLTGGTGFVGRFLLAELLRESRAKIYCLVRAKSQREAAVRLQETLLRWELWGHGSERLVAVAGDLRLPRLGIEQKIFDTLVDEVDVIYHCATSMNHLETYAMARAANVGSAKELLKLATTARPKLINYISTLGVFGAAPDEPPRTVIEHSSIDHERYLQSHGYLASKWVSEKIFMLARDRGIPCNIFRLGLVWADAEGRFDELQSVYRIMKSSLLSGYGINGYRFPMPPTPVDYVARAVVFLANRHGNGDGTFHIASADQAIDDVFERCNDIAGTSLELLPYYDWIFAIKRLHDAGHVLPAVPIIEYAFAMDEPSFEQHQKGVRSAVNVRFDLSRTHRELEEAGIRTPVLDDDLLRACLERMFTDDPKLERLWGGAVAHGRSYSRIADRTQARF